jgi:hypothetical protein
MSGTYFQQSDFLRWSCIAPAWRRQAIRVRAFATDETPDRRERLLELASLLDQTIAWWCTRPGPTVK